MNVNKLATWFDNFSNSKRPHSYFHFTDNTSVNIEYCTEIINYSENLIVLRTAKNLIRIIGFELKMRNYAENCLNIYGKISSLDFDEI